MSEAATPEVGPSGFSAPGSHRYVNFCCAKCHTFQPKKGSRVKHYLGLRQSICAKCLGDRK